MWGTVPALGHFCRRLMPRSSATVRGMCDRADYAMSNMKSMFDLGQENIIVSSYSNLGFKVSPGIKVVGPVVLFPNTVLHWNVKSAAHVDKHSLVLFSLLEPKLDMLIIGKGMAADQIKPDVQLFLKSKGVNVEVLPTEQACGLFNMLSNEGRNIAAALIPPEKVQINYDEVYLTDDGLSMPTS